MGIKDLWTILTPFCQHVPLHKLEGQRVAVDLSGWVCQAQNLNTENALLSHMYLRNLYFRTYFLLAMDVEPIFILEGKAPELKLDTISARNHANNRCRSGEKRQIRDRTTFNLTLKRCAQMLALMGLECQRAEGEAEAYCAQLNRQKLVDGVISQDSDCFAYGAEVVYRNFSITSQGGTVDCYDLNYIQNCTNSSDFGRNKMIALALLCGSDYGPGVHGVGLNAALKLFKCYADADILQKMTNWRTDTRKFDKLEAELARPHCKTCGHLGTMTKHTKNGCKQCQTVNKCHQMTDDNSTVSTRPLVVNELTIRRKALSQYPTTNEFPNQTVIDEFLRCQNHMIFHLDKVYTWNRPDLVNFVKFSRKYLTWPEIYAFEKFLPLLTRWQLVHFKATPTLRPVRICKRRAPKGVASYEILWCNSAFPIDNLIPADQLENCKNIEKLWCTIEPQHLVKCAYPHLVAEYENTMRKSSRSNRIVTKSVDRRKTSSRTIDSYFKAVSKSCSTPIKICQPMTDADSCSSDDLSDIIDDIVSAQLPYDPQTVYHNNQQMLTYDRCDRSSFFLTTNDISTRHSNLFDTSDVIEIGDSSITVS